MKHLLLHCFCKFVLADEVALLALEALFEAFVALLAILVEQVMSAVAFVVVLSEEVLATAALLYLHMY